MGEGGRDMTHEEYEALLDKYAAVVLQGAIISCDEYNFLDQYKNPTTGEIIVPSTVGGQRDAIRDGFKLHRTANQALADYCFEMAGEMIKARKRFLNQTQKVE
jgi:hypothetical protein